MGYCLDHLRNEQATVYPALLFMPEELREDVAALYAFHLETGNIAYRVSEPLPGEIRLQWWQDVLDPADSIDRSREAEANPLAKTLIDVINRHGLPREGFSRYLNARIFDLFHDVMPDRISMEAYFGETDSFILSMSCRIAGQTISPEIADACGHGGVAIGIARRLTLLHRDRVMGKTYLPLDLLQSASLDREAWIGEKTSNHDMAVTAYIAMGREHAKRAREVIWKLPKPVTSIFLPVAQASAVLDGMKKPGELLAQEFSLNPLRQQWALWKAVIFGF